MHELVPSHLLSNAHKSVRENSQLDWIEFFADGSLASGANLNLNVAAGCHFGNASRLDEDCAQTIDNYSRAIDGVTMSKVLQ